MLLFITLTSRKYLVYFLFDILIEYTCWVKPSVACLIVPSADDQNMDLFVKDGDQNKDFFVG